VRIWHQCLSALENTPAYRTALEAHFKSVVGADVVVDLHGTVPGSTQINDPAAFPQHEPNRRIGYTYALSLHKEQFVRAALRAEEEGYDAFYIATFADSGFEEIRSLLTIPVVTYCQSSLLFAASLGAPIGFVLFVEAAEAQLRRHALLYGLRDLIGPVVYADFGYGEVMAAFEDPSEVVKAFTEAAERAVEQGAKVLVPGEGPLNILLATAGVSQVAGVPVIDSLGVGAVYAEMRARFYRRSGLTHAQTGFYYATPPQALVEGLREQYYGNGKLGSR
jgi:allantoin racemase